MDVTDLRSHRVSLILAIFGALLMLATAYVRIGQYATDDTLPRFKSSQPTLPDWPRQPPKALA